MRLAGEHPTDEGREWRLSVVLAGLFFLTTVLAALDLTADIGDASPLLHAAVEGSLLLMGLGGLGLLSRRLLSLAHRLREARDAARSLSADLAASRLEAARWREEAHDLLAGLGAAIDTQFGRWELTAAEREVALLLLKGLSHKEIGEVRAVGEATVRQQARAIYRKAGLGGRHDLAAFFLEELLLPPTQVS